MEKIRAKRLLIDQNLDFGNNKIVNLNDPSAANDGVNFRTLQNYVEKYVRTGIVKDPVVAATNTTFVGGAYVPATDSWTGVASPPVIDGVLILNGDSFLIESAVDARGCGVWVYDSAGAALHRREDMDNVEETPINNRVEVRGGIIIPVSGGTVNDNRYFTLSSPNGNASLGVDALVFTVVNPAFAGGSKPSPAGKNQFVAAPLLAGGPITADQSSTGIALTESPIVGGYVDVRVGGVSHTVGNRTTSAFYFSATAGATAKTPANYATGDVLYVNPTVLGYSIDASDRFDLHYNV